MEKSEAELALFMLSRKYLDSKEVAMSAVCQYKHS